jgi:hypothetical protein
MQEMDGITIEFPGSTQKVVRIGETVRRQPHRNAPAIQALLGHLEKAGFDGAPRAFGFDDQGREIISYIPGRAGHYPLQPHVLSESTLVRLGLLLRDFHDATASFSLPVGVVWHDAVKEAPEIICHGDAGPYNVIFRNGNPVALIDFERATPGPRVWDIAFVVYRFAPLCGLSEQGMTLAFLRQIARRIRMFSDAYGFSDTDNLLRWVQLRLRAEIDLFESGAADDPIRRQQKIEAGHVALYKRDLRLIGAVSESLAQAI